MWESLLEHLHSPNRALRQAAMLKLQEIPLEALPHLVAKECQRPETPRITRGLLCALCMSVTFLLLFFADGLLQTALPLLLVCLTLSIHAGAGTPSQALNYLAAYIDIIEDPRFFIYALEIRRQAKKESKTYRALFTVVAAARVQRAVMRLRPRLRLEHIAAWTGEQKHLFLQQLSYPDLETLLAIPGAIDQFHPWGLFDVLSRLALQSVSTSQADARQMARNCLIERVLPNLLAQQSGLLTEPQSLLFLSVLKTPEADPEFTICVLDMLRYSNSDRIVRAVTRIVEMPTILKLISVQKAARECLSLLKERARQSQQAQTLLRASDGVYAAGSNVLLRPVSSDNGTIASEQLLRASLPE